MPRLVVTAPLRRGSASAVRRILAEGPPFDLERTSLERHQVFLSDDALVLVFEGPHAGEEVRALTDGVAVLDRALQIGPHLAAAPELPAEVSAWERPHTLEGLSFAATPGPGDSEGGSWG
jgi:hypothetical protein